MPDRWRRSGRRSARGRLPAAWCRIGWTTPAMILMSVDLPAPFSPSSAWIEPLAGEVDSSSARTPHALADAGKLQEARCHDGRSRREDAGHVGILRRLECYWARPLRRASCHDLDRRDVDVTGRNSLG
jgi:hypothetical protein